MSSNTKTRSALRATLQQEDAALADRLDAEIVATPSPAPEAAVPGSPPHTAPKPKPAPKTAAKRSSRASTPPVAEAAAAEPVAEVITTTPAAESAPSKKKPSGKRLAPVAEQAETAAPRKEKEKADKHDKVVRDSFSMPASEHAGLKALRINLARNGCLASKSEILRAGLRLLTGSEIEALQKLIGELPVVAKGKRKKR